MNTSNHEAYRIKDFIQFHNESSQADNIVIQLKTYLELANKNSKREKELACLLYSLTYSVPSTIVLLEKFKEFINNPNVFWQNYKSKLIFQSDRKYIKINNAFNRAFFDFYAKKVFDYLDNKQEIDIEDAVNKIEKVFFFKRFSAFLFLEVYCCLFDKKTINIKLDWKNGSTVTSGILNVLGQDGLADEWDKKHNLKMNFKYFDILAQELLTKVTYGKEMAILETNLCAYRKLFKGSRYVGYYADRVLEELYKTINNFPEHAEALSLLFNARELVIPIKYLGEKNNWVKIRKEMKKRYLQTGDWRW